MYPKHDEDFYGWTIATADLLKQKQYQELDIEGLIEEVESMSASEKRELINRLSQLIFHLLKWQLQVDFRGRSWVGSINFQREEIELILKDSPSLVCKIIDIMPIAYKKAKLLIQKETPIDLKSLPLGCPYTFEQIINPDYWPD